jgi:hypothetical protein
MQCFFVSDDFMWQDLEYLVKVSNSIEGASPAMEKYFFSFSIQNIPYSP